MKSKYAGTCKHCGDKFDAGTEIKWLGKGRGVMHVECAKKANLPITIHHTDESGEVFTVEYTPPIPTGKDEPCGRCGSTGQFITGSVNGKLTGPGGICFRCNGKGYQNDADRTRNYWHDVKQVIH